LEVGPAFGNGPFFPFFRLLWTVRRRVYCDPHGFQPVPRAEEGPPRRRHGRGGGGRHDRSRRLGFPGRV